MRLATWFDTWEEVMVEYEYVVCAHPGEWKVEKVGV